MTDYTATLLRPDGRESLGTHGPNPWQDGTITAKHLIGEYASPRNFIRFRLSVIAPPGPWVIRRRVDERYVGIYYSHDGIKTATHEGQPVTMEEAVRTFQRLGGTQYPTLEAS